MSTNTIPNVMLFRSNSDIILKIATQNSVQITGKVITDTRRNSGTCSTPRERPTSTAARLQSGGPGSSAELGAR